MAADLRFSLVTIGWLERVVVPVLRWDVAAFSGV